MISLTEDYNRRFKLIAKHEYTDRSKLVRRMIDEKFKEEYEDSIENEE